MRFLAALLLCLMAGISPVMADRLSQEGWASTYGNNDGHEWSRTAHCWKAKRRTVCERVNPNDLTAAHRTLPFNARVKVTNKKNGRSVIVRINDRGPFKRGRIIDLTPAAAKQIGSTGLAQVRIDSHRIVASTGAKASVSTMARPHFQCLIGKLESVGYRIDFMGGYASRGNSSAHPTGNALDINQTSRNRVTRPLPANATEMAHGCGLTHGATWRSPDQGHFEMPRKYGYVFKRSRTRYASAH